MNLRQVVESRDFPIEDRVLQVIWDVFQARSISLTDDDKKAIERSIATAFLEGDRAWADEELVAIVGADRAGEFLRRREARML